MSITIKQLADGLGTLLLAGISEEAVVTDVDIENGEVSFQTIVPEDEIPEIEGLIEDNVAEIEEHDVPETPKWRRQHSLDPGCWCKPVKGDDGAWYHRSESLQ